MNFSVVMKIIYRVWSKIQKGFLLNKYNDFNIAEFFRKQGAVIGDNCRIEVRSLGAEPYLIEIGNHCTIAPGVVFVNHDGATWLFTEEIPSLQNFGTIKILDNCFIGLNAILMGKNITIGPNSIVAAGAVVTKDVPAATVVGGNPSRVLSTIDQYKEKVIKNWNQLKPKNYFDNAENNLAYSPEQIQNLKNRDLILLKRHLINHFKYQ